MSTVAIIGAGVIGGAAAQAMASSRQISRIVLFDASTGAASGKALDLQQCGPVTHSHVRFEGTGDWSRLVGCAVCVVADGMSDPAGEWRDDEGLAMLSRIQPLLGRTPIVFAGTTQTTLLGRAAMELGIDRRRLIGSAPVAFVSSIAALVAVDARSSPRDIALTVLGVPPLGLVVPWSGASIGGYPLLHVLSAPQLSRLEARSRGLWPPGAFSAGAAAAHVVDAVLGDSRQSMPVLTWLTGEYGVRNRAGVVHAALGTAGIRHIHTPELTSGERVRLLSALGG